MVVRRKSREWVRRVDLLVQNHTGWHGQTNGLMVSYYTHEIFSPLAELREGGWLLDQRPVQELLAHTMVSPILSWSAKPDIKSSDATHACLEEWLQYWRALGAKVGRKREGVPTWEC